MGWAPQGNRRGGGPAWLNDSRRLLFIDQERLKLMDSRDGRVRDLGPARDVVERMSLSPDNRRAYLTVSSPDADI